MMSQDCFQAGNWYQALKLTERVASLGVRGRQIAENGYNAELAERRIQRWRSQKPLTKPVFFDAKLTQEGITEQEFRFLLGESMRSLAERFPTIPEWLREIEQAFSTADCSNLKSVITSDNFLCAIAPLIHQGINRLQAGLQAIEVNQKSRNNVGNGEWGMGSGERNALFPTPLLLSSKLPFDSNSILSILLADLPQHLLWMLTPTMVLELNVARLQGLLSGETAQERYLSFLQRLQEQDVAIQLLQDYPVLARQLALCIQQHIEVKLEFIQRLCTDWAAICTAFSPDKEPGVLEQINCSISDNHNGGRSVVIAKFQSGFKVVYKPKPLAVDVHFQDLLYWINQKADFLPLKPLKIINCGTYGWVEFIESSSCSHQSQIERFYQRMGGYLALLYALDATDFHLENLIASGEHPMPIDLETLFQPRKVEPNSPEAIFIANQRMAQSVFRVGLLPQRLWRQGESAGIEVSGIGATDGQIMPERILTLAGKGTDEMRMIRQQIPLPESQNRPRLHEAQVNVLDYKEAIITGFTTIYQFLMKHRDELLAQDGLLTRFASDEVRVVLRESRTYALLLRESFHPDVLRDALNRDRLFDRLWVDVENRSYLTQLIKAEQESLWQGDIPKFTTYPNSRELRLNEQEQIPDFFETSGMEQVRHRIQQLNPEDLAWQVRLIESSLYTLGMDAEAVEWVSVSLPEIPTIPEQETLTSELLQTACTIAECLESLALRDGEMASWIGIRLMGKHHWAVAPLGWSLFDGIPGIALFFAYLGEITQESRYTKLAQQALFTLQRQVEYDRSIITSIGAFDGWGGLIYTLTHLGSLWRQPQLLNQALEWVDILPGLIENDNQLDIIGGAAGCIGALVALYQSIPDERIKAVAIQCGDHLLGGAKGNRIISQNQAMEQGRAWMPGDGTNPLTGFSHGAAGMAWALLELATLTGEERFRSSAVGAITDERSLFSPDTKNWLNQPGERDTFSVAWSYGAPGIGLARLHSLKHLEDAQIPLEINTALETTLAHGFCGNHSLCNGMLGNLEFLLQVSQTPNYSTWHSPVTRLAASILESLRQQGWCCGVPLGVETLGLMTGLAGIGYGLLRLAAPDKIPSILVLSPPNTILD
ncbi:type 2 lanthipeptide synthetase LanM family protein [Allocoleopsis franciscana]|uniref:Type 2 lantibiotic biosynthesis protein LanM n=1 Tax=Allocoleopsis franciscana PCC 7113 TaxID=1173027 RepID=K9WEE4_9CYAN|nr:type 2 lanthipeptide synthetase LanM family protein [Allocoleopsis franciscana]AFZ18780.1 type 2 lantibiotic biosynthesis protein LanM [Allocoleopsis franciscana PCC 7113]